MLGLVFMAAEVRLTDENFLDVHKSEYVMCASGWSPAMTPNVAYNHDLNHLS